MVSELTGVVLTLDFPAMGAAVAAAHADDFAFGPPGIDIEQARDRGGCRLSSRQGDWPWPGDNSRGMRGGLRDGARECARYPADPDVLWQLSIPLKRMHTGSGHQSRLSLTSEGVVIEGQCSQRRRQCAAVEALRLSVDDRIK
jgi:hypothetical protein